jgi:hypothetical protein
VCAMLAAGAAPVPPVPANQAPPPRAVKPDMSLVYIEWIFSDGDEPNRTRIHRLGFRNGKMLPAETVWEGEEDFLNVGFRDQTVVANRYFVTERGGVIDLREKKVINSEREASTVRVDDAKVVYWTGGQNRVEGLFAFEYATGTVTRVGNALPPKPWHDRLGLYRLSPDLKKAVTWDDGEELTLHREGDKPKSLGKGFLMQEDPKWALTRSQQFMLFPVLWLDNDRLLTQRGHGNLVLVALAGKVTEVAKIKDAPQFATPRLARDITGNIFYHLEGEVYRVDPEKKTAVKSEWRSLGHGFEATWKQSDKLGYKFRHNGKDIGQFRCWPELSRTVPGYLALSTTEGERTHGPRRVAVWSEATGEWVAVHYKCLSLNPLIGWIK